MPKVPRIKGAEAIKGFEKHGFKVIRISGDHYIMAKAGHDMRLSIPVKAGKDVGVGLLASQIKAAGLTVQQFIDAL